MAFDDKIDATPFLRDVSADTERNGLVDEPRFLMNDVATTKLRWANRCNIRLFALLSIILVAIPALTLKTSEIKDAVTQLGQAKAQNHVTTDCGSSPEEARAAGCKFDIMNFGWFAPECWDQELYDEMAQYRAWNWTTLDKKHVPAEEVATGSHYELLTTWEFHLVHCVYAWRKLTRSVLRGRPLDEWSARYMHTKHCGHELLDGGRFPAHAMITLTTSWYPKCGLDDAEMLDMLTRMNEGDEEGDDEMD